MINLFTGTLESAAVSPLPNNFQQVLHTYLYQCY